MSDDAFVIPSKFQLCNEDKIKEAEEDAEIMTSREEVETTKNKKNIEKNRKHVEDDESKQPFLATNRRQDIDDLDYQRPRSLQKSWKVKKDGEGRRLFDEKIDLNDKP